MGFGSQYVGNPTATQSPDYPPAAGQRASIYLASNLDGADWANVQQALKDLVDKHAYLISNRPWTWRQLLHMKTSITTTQDPITNFGDLTATISGATSSIAFNDPGAISSGYNKRTASITAGSTNGNLASLTSSSPVAGFANSANLIVCAEMDVALNAAGLTNTDAIIGFSGFQSMASTPSNFFGFRRTIAVGTHWQGYVASTAGGAAASVTATGTFDPVAATFQHLKMEFFGASTPQGTANGSAFARFTINETLIGNVNLAANQVPGPNLYFGAGADDVAAAASGIVYAGQWIVTLDGY